MLPLSAISELENVPYQFNGEDGFNFNAFKDIDFHFYVDFLNQHEQRYINPKPGKEIPEQRLYFEHAKDLAKAIEIKKNQRAHVILSGNFIFGDFIEAFFVEKNIKTKRLIISTLSMSQNNIDSLVNLFYGRYIDSLDLVISDYFFAHERHDLIPYMLKELDINNRFQLAVAGSHTKICLFESVVYGLKYVIHGSSNLRSSNCIEQITIEENAKLYDFYKDFHEKILSEYSIINKSIRGDKLWQVVHPVAQVVESGDHQAQGEEEGKAPIQDRKRHSDILESKYF